MKISSGLFLLVTVLATACGEGTDTMDASFDVARPTVTVATHGNGAGSVTAAQATLSCPGTCALTVDHGSQVTLTAAPRAGSVFLGWNGTGCSGTGTCAVTLDADQSVTASFGLDHSLVVIETGSGTGTVASSPAGIACGADCSHVYDSGAVVVLNATAAADSQFVGWKGGGCADTGPCTVTVHTAALVEAQFHHLCRLTISRLGLGGGVVTSRPSGISCGADCTDRFVCGTNVQLRAVAHNSTFAGWSNGCSGTGVCMVTLVDASTTIGAAFTVCGNRVIEPGEECDDGNRANGDTCENTCTLPRCGNGIRDLGEQCDDGNTVNGDHCDNNCTRPRCGNGIVDPGEQCDDGNLFSGDGCSSSCTIEFCGNGVLDPGEECDDGNLVNGDGCENTCTLPRCGNGIVDVGEQCDDGNLVNGDGCSSSCNIELCGNGFVDPGEQCDDGNLANGDGCSSICLLELCGNGIVDPGEQCDDGNLLNGDGCSAACRIELCGNGLLDPGEQCDTGGATATCDVDCTLPQCGDGLLNLVFTAPGAAGPEQCDDGNTVNGDGCSSTCRLEP